MTSNGALVGITGHSEGMESVELVFQAAVACGCGLGADTSHAAA